jgi:putative ABC transport system permease protein
MFQNYLKTALRNLRRHKAHAAINIAGLTIGMAVALSIGIWIADELNFNKSIPRYDRIAQVYQASVVGGEKAVAWGEPIPLAEELRTHYGSNFRYVVMGNWASDHLMTVGTKVVKLYGQYMEGDAPYLLSLNMLRGSREGIRKGYTILLSRSSATALFGDKDPMGQVVQVNNKQNLKVTGLYEDIPANSNFGDRGWIASWPAYLATDPDVANMSDPWGNNSWMVYTEIAPNTTMAEVSAHISLAKFKNCQPGSRQYHPTLFLQPMSRWHLYSEFKNGINTGGRIQYVWLFGIIGVFVLLLACINFMNLSTARSERRAKEVGIRKAIGSLRGQLIRQFFMESLLMAGIAWVLALLLCSMWLPAFNSVAGKEMRVPWGSPTSWVMGLGFCVVTGLIAGSYPALYLSSFRPVKVLKGTFRAGRLAALPRKVLVVLQFTVSVCLIIGTVVVFRQVQYAMNRPVGYDQNRLVSIYMYTKEVHQHFDAVRTELMAKGAIEDMAEAGGPATDIWGTNGGLDWEGKDPNRAVEFANTGVSPGYGHAVGWQFVAGRDFSKDFATDTVAFVINEAAVKYMGIKDPVGKIMKWDGEPFHIIGVIKDMLMASPYEPVMPSLFCMARDHDAFEMLRLNRNQSAAKSLATIKSVFARYSPSQPFDYEFVDEAYGRKFGDEQRTGRLAAIFAVLAIFISCLGLFGMAAYMAEQRTKEIGVRKVLGAGILGLWGMLSKDFVVLVGVALLIAIPLSWYGMHQWLLGYEYRSGMAWWIFAATAAGAILITLLTVSVQAVRAAMVNPIKSLRSE